MDYEKKYKEALEKARKLQENSNGMILKKWLWNIFPELKEMEDGGNKRISKEIAQFLKQNNGWNREWLTWLEKQSNKSVNIDVESMVSSYKQRLKSQAGIKMENNPLVNMSLTAFRHGVENTLEELNLKKLENQDEPNPYSGVSFEYNGHTWGMCARDGGVEILIDGEIKEKVFLDNKSQDKSALEAIKEEKVDNQTCVKPTDKFKPKFKVGDWISNDMCDVHIASIENGMYYFDEGDGLSIVFVDEHYHLWTIEDAMDGDVLCCESGWTCIFKTLNSDNISFSSYCFMDNTGWFCETGSESHTLEKAFIKAYNGEIYPATKEQRDLLFQKMKALQEKGKCTEFAHIPMDDVFTWLEKQGNKLKFHEGDFIKHNKASSIYKIISVNSGSYYVENIRTNNRIELFNADKNFHLWTIADAKDGDILQLGIVTVIFQKCIGNNCKCYCSVCEGEFEIPSRDGDDNSYGCYNATPATKEQRNTLFATMKEAGYIWIFSKKELIKVEQNPTKWSEEDERNFQNIDAVLFYDKKLPEDTCIKLRNFLKTLRQRCI